jgi:hypothetical protein
MIERYVFIKLKPEYATDQGRAEVRAHSETLRTIPEVTGLAIGTPADAGAIAAWDVSLVVRCATLAAVQRYLNDPVHDAYYERFLRERAQVIKAWNFEV